MQYPLGTNLCNCYNPGMEDIERFRKNVERLRKERGISARGLSLAIGKGESYVQSLESGLRVKEIPKMPTVEALANQLRVSPDQLLGRVAVPIPMPNLDGDYDYGEIRTFVESNPDPQFQMRLRRQEARRSDESYKRLILRIFKAWLSNADLGLGEAEEE
jgi:transcriptional regulator with XRE-family HTH domain